MVLKERLAEARLAWKKEATAFLIFSAVAFAMGDVLFGIDTGSFGSIQALPPFLSQFAPLDSKTKKHAFTTEQKSIMNSVVFPGKLIGVFCFEPLVSWAGYKKAMYVVAVMQSIGLIVQLNAKSWEMFTGGRVIAYYAVGIVENVVPTYLAEISPTSLRGFFAGLMNVVTVCGQLWGTGMGRAYATETAKKGWLIPVAVQFIPVVAIFFLVPFCRESPRWLITKGRREEAIASLDRIRPKSDVLGGLTVAEIDAMELAVHEAQAMDQGKWRELLRGTYPRRCLISTWLFMCNQCCGNQFINLYGPTFFKQIGLQTAAFSYTTMITAVGIVAAIAAILVVDVVGRRTILIIGLSLAALFNAITGAVGAHKTLSQTDINTIVASLTLVIVGNKMSVNPLSYVVSTEIGGTKMRKKIMAVGMSMDVVFAFAMSYSIPYLIGTPGANLGPKIGYFFMAICIASLIYVIGFVPEVTGRSLEEVDELFERRLWAWQFAKAETHGIGRTIAELELGRDARHKAQASGPEENRDDKRDVAELA